MNKIILIRGGGCDLSLLWITRSTSLAEASSRTDTSRLYPVCAHMCMGGGSFPCYTTLASGDVCSPGQLQAAEPTAKVVYGSHCSLWKGSQQRVETKRSHCSPQKRGDIEPKSPPRTLPILLKKLLSFELLDVSHELAPLAEGNVVLDER